MFVNTWKFLVTNFMKKLNFLPVSEMFWKKISINLIIDLLSSKCKNVVYDTIFIIVNKCTKIIRYLLINIKIDIAKLTIFFFEIIILGFDMSADIVNDKNFLLINTFWLTVYYYTKIKRWLNIIFHS